MENLEQIEQEEILPSQPSSKRKYLLIGVITAFVVLVGVGILVLLTQKEAPSQAPTLKTEPAVPQEQAQPSKTDESQEPSLSFVKPMGNISANTGEIISITLEGTDVIEALLVGSGFAESKESDGTGSFTFQYRVPLEATGTVKLQATGKTSSGSFVESDELMITISLSSAGEIVSMRVLPDDIILFEVGDTRHLRVYGTFSDGVEREITSANLGTKYILYTGQPLDTEIMRVNDEGKITAVNSGQRSIVITHENYSGNAVSVMVRVQ